jgi:hypothetical protein
MPLPEPKPYTRVRLIEDKNRPGRYEVRVSTYVEFDENPGRRAISGKPDKEQALKTAKAIARGRRLQWPDSRD